MKIAKANPDDLALAHELAGALEALSGNWGAVMPQSIAKPSEGEETEPFDIDNPEQCRRIAEYLFALGRKASLFRVAIGMQALLDPDTGLIDPNKSYLDAHPRIKAALSAEAAKPEATKDQAKQSSCAPHPLDASLPERIWLQIDTEGSPDDREEPFRGDISDLTWCAESIGGLEVEYVRKDLLVRDAAEGKHDPA